MVVLFWAGVIAAFAELALGIAGAIAATGTIIGLPAAPVIAGAAVLLAIAKCSTIAGSSLTGAGPPPPPPERRRSALIKVRSRPVAAAVLACVFGVLHLVMACLSATAFGVARFTADKGGDFARESAAGRVWQIAFIVQALLAFGWVGRLGSARERVVRAGVRAAFGVLIATLLIVAVGLSRDAFRGSIIAFCIMLLFTKPFGVGPVAFVALALTDKHRTVWARRCKSWISCAAGEPCAMDLAGTYCSVIAPQSSR